MIALGGMIGIGLLVGSGAGIRQAGPSVLVSIVYAGLLVFLVMKVLSEQMRVDPGRGSFLHYIGAGNGAWSVFVSGWLYWLYWVMVIAVEALGGGEILHPYISLPAWMTALCLISCVALINIVSTRMFGEIEFVLTLFKILFISFFCLSCIWFVFSDLYNIKNAFGINLIGKPFFPNGIRATLYSVPIIMFTMAGSEVITLTTQDTHCSSEQLSWLSRLVGIRMAGLYLLPIFLVLLILPSGSLQPGQSPFAATFRNMGLDAMVSVMSIMIVLTLVSCLNSSIYISSRVLVNLSSVAHAPQIFMGQGAASPVHAILMSSLVSMGMVLFSSFVSPHAFEFLLNSSGCVVLIVYFLITTSFLRCAKTGNEATMSRSMACALMAAIMILGTSVCLFFDADMRAEAVGCGVLAGIAYLSYRAFIKQQEH
ncbi:amino acid permease [Komagataeibacter sp. FNDCF1]|uniref:amino acid permease n=1 Tax=Komagataeibacter sp. FNDCF1 TaxID=2878681 RepID=UPI001E2D66B6|nr:amino acid permease [Komagataeibacter sp. FNDCF1]MCE2563309.1 amino acid permease [Komagataeibacter sp. FNDCF1]